LVGILFLASFSSGHAQTEKIRSFLIRSGSLTPIAPPGRGYVFRSDSGEEEVFDMSGKAFLQSSNVSLPGIPGLREVGFKLDAGAEYLYRTLGSLTATWQVAESEHPNSKMVALIFEGEAGSRLEVALEGPTAVFRTDLKFNGLTITLWSNRKPIVPVK
jgi:hypothetical protein